MHIQIKKTCKELQTYIYFTTQFPAFQYICRSMETVFKYFFWVTACPVFGATCQLVLHFHIHTEMFYKVEITWSQIGEYRGWSKTSHVERTSQILCTSRRMDNVHCCGPEVYYITKGAILALSLDHSFFTVLQYLSAFIATLLGR